MSDSLLLANGTDHLLLADGESRLLLAQVESTSGWTPASAELFADIVAEFGIIGGLIFGEADGIDCVVTPVKTEFEQTTNAYMRTASVMIECLRQDAVSVGLYAALDNARPRVTVGGTEYQIIRVENDDPTIAYLELFATRLI